MDKRHLGLIIFFLFTSQILLGQQILTPDSYQSDIWDFERLKHDTTELNVHYTIKEHAESAFEVLNPITKISFNSKFPYGYNDGAVWKGKGFNYELHAGFSGSVGILSYTFQPVFYSAQNKEFQLAETRGSANPYNYQFNPGRIDWVQRFGDENYSSFNLGQSEVKLAYKGLKVAASTQNFSVGPAVYFPIMMSNNGSGMPNINLGTDGRIPLDLGFFDLGKIEGNFIFGRMIESSYFDNDNSNDNRYYNSYHFSYTPWFAPDLTIGVNKMLYKQSRFFERGDIFSLIRNKNVPFKIVNSDTVFSAGNDFFDQMVSITGEWFFREVGFRVYGEYALNDYSSRPRILEPEHSRGYVLGFQKLFEASKFDVVLNYEHLNISRNHTYLWRANPTYYAHGTNLQGYTHKGQIMGASTGPGSNADHLEIKLKLKKQSLILGAHGRRTEFNKDYFVTHDPEFRKHHVGLEFGVNSYYENERLVFGLEIVHAYEYNRYYDPNNGQRNMYVSLSLLAKVNK